MVEVVRGADAVALLKEASSLNGEHPDAAMEYVVVKVHARYAGTDAGTHHIDATFFRGAGGDGVAYDRVRMTEADPPSPSMSSFEDLTAGGEVEGWVVVQVAKDEAGILLVVHPRDNGVILGDETIRYLSLE